MSEDDFDVLAYGIVVGRISAVGCGRWPTGPHENRTPIHGYEAISKRSAGLPQIKIVVGMYMGT